MKEETLSTGKNSNCIKKIGRIILERENIEKYKIRGEVNEGVERMLESVREKKMSSKGIKE